MGSRAVWTPSYGRCRFCRASALQREMVKYGERHWAHPVCLYQRKGIEVIDALHTWQLRHLPVLAMMEVGVTVDQVQAWTARIDAEDREHVEHAGPGR